MKKTDQKTPRLPGRQARRENRVGYLFAGPAILGFLLFALLPILISLAASFTDWNMLSAPEFIGLQNYKNLLTEDFYFWRALKATFYYAILSVIISNLVALAVALLLNANAKLQGVFRTIYYLPTVVPAVAQALLWGWLFNVDYGLFNNILNMLGFDSIKWITSKKMAMPSIAIMSIWQAMGYDMILLTAGLKGIDETYYEAAQIDGANGWQSFWKITLPMLTPTLFFLVVTHCVSYIQMFDAAFIMTEGGPGHATRTFAMQIYNTAFEYFRMGEAASYAWVLFAIVFVITVIQFKLQDKWVNYDV